MCKNDSGKGFKRLGYLHAPLCTPHESTDVHILLIKFNLFSCLGVCVANLSGNLSTLSVPHSS